MKFKREQRYIVLKLKDITLLSEEQKTQLDGICRTIDLIRIERNAKPLECVVIESDWVCYTAAWGFVEIEQSIEGSKT